MSRVTIKEISHSDDVSVSDPNTTLSNWGTASGNINVVNIREEGLDEGCLADNSVQLQFQHKAIPNSFTITDQSYTLYPIGLGSGASVAKFDDTFDLSDTTATLLIRASLEYAMDREENIYVSKNDQPMVSIVFRWSTDAHSSSPGSWNTIDVTERHYGFHNSVAAGQSTSTALSASTERPFNVHPDGVKMRGTHTVAHIFDADTVSYNSTVTIGLFAKITGGSAGSTGVDLRDITLTAEKFGR